MGAGFWCFTLFAARRAEFGVSSCAGASEGDELPSSMQESVHAWATLFGFFSHEVSVWNGTQPLTEGSARIRLVAEPEELATNLMRKCDSCTGDSETHSAWTRIPTLRMRCLVGGIFNLWLYYIEELKLTIPFARRFCETLGDATDADAAASLCRLLIVEQVERPQDEDVLQRLPEWTLVL